MTASASSHPSVPIWENLVPGNTCTDAFRPTLDLFPAVHSREAGAVLIFPGGGYSGRAQHEGSPIAAAFNAAGLHAFVLQYRVAPHRHPEPIMDASRALRMIRSRAAEWRVKPDRIAVCGFSAGGHLAASLGTLHARFRFEQEDPLHPVSNRPDALILCYPVISAGSQAHRGSFENLLGRQADDPSLRQLLSAELQAGPHTPPTFLWHTASDPVVPVGNSLLFAQALKKHDVPFSLHVFPEGNHGLGLAQKTPEACRWMELCCGWLKSLDW